MFKKKTPEGVLNSVAEGINAGDLDSLMMLYEADACFASQPGQLAKSPESVRQSLRKASSPCTLSILILAAIVFVACRLPSSLPYL